MMNPDHVLSMLDELIDAYGCGKLFKFLHLPVQSGDDTVLELMNRYYTVDEFRMVVNSFREKIPRLTLSTDIICGFPKESTKAFENTKSLISEIKPDIVNVSKFFARPSTPAEKLVPVLPKELNRRSRELAELSRRISLEKNKVWLGWKGTVLFDEHGKDESWVGRNFAYKPVVVKTKELLLGKFAQVKVVKTFSTYLEAEIT
jgi:tRNA A37 methylthiotransferase MiaB